MSEILAAGYENSQTSGLGWKSDFRAHKWFTRGWTLQELLAPASVEFFAQDGRRLGDKRSLERQISEITGIAVRALRGSDLSHLDVDERFGWAETRQTSVEEDWACCLQGIFGIFMPLIYAEGKQNAPLPPPIRVLPSSDFCPPEGGTWRGQQLPRAVPYLSRVLGILSVWPSAQYESFWRDLDTDAAYAQVESSCDGWLARYELRAPLHRRHTRQSFRYEHRASWKTSFPMAIGPDGLTLAMLANQRSSSAHNRRVAGQMEREQAPHVQSRNARPATSSSGSSVALARDWYRYSTTFSADSRDLLFSDRLGVSTGHLVLFWILDGGAVRVVASTTFHCLKPRSIQLATVHPLLAILPFVSAGPRDEMSGEAQKEDQRKRRADGGAGQVSSDPRARSSKQGRLASGLETSMEPCGKARVSLSSRPVLVRQMLSSAFTVLVADPYHNLRLGSESFLAVEEALKRRQVDEDLYAKERSRLEEDAPRDQAGASSAVDPSPTFPPLLFPLPLCLPLSRAFVANPAANGLRRGHPRGHLRRGHRSKAPASPFPSPQASPQTSSHAEIEALSKSIGTVRDIAQNDFSIHDVRITYGFKYLIKAMTIWIENWIENDGNTSASLPVAHFAQLKTIHQGIDYMQYSGKGGL
ncbi:hypothetical protein MKZ38_010693 [Zalerion maritima]|uniref:Vegetative incompatibility protein HET-E-1 n=1 Tax=Zalerion maritima TaxID=339359 RepID=A0AAD5S078_9PEZI|nr:hypothetical protein MKZ38_010693 [Zalerion maritima]